MHLGARWEGKCALVCDECAVDVQLGRDSPRSHGGPPMHGDFFSAQVGATCCNLVQVVAIHCEQLHKAGKRPLAPRPPSPSKVLGPKNTKLRRTTPKNIKNLVTKVTSLHGYKGRPDGRRRFRPCYRGRGPFQKRLQSYKRGFSGFLFEKIAKTKGYKKGYVTFRKGYKREREVHHGGTEITGKAPSTRE